MWKNLGFEKEALGSLTIDCSKCRIIIYKLINQADIDMTIFLPLKTSNSNENPRTGMKKPPLLS
jgi:hypothetical protein